MVFEGQTATIVALSCPVSMGEVTGDKGGDMSKKRE